MYFIYIGSIHLVETIFSSFFSSGKIFNTLCEKELISYLTNSSVFTEDIAEWEPSASATFSPLIRYIFVNLLMNELVYERNQKGKTPDSGHDNMVRKLIFLLCRTMLVQNTLQVLLRVHQ